MIVRSKMNSRIRQIGVRVQDSVFDRIRQLATTEGKTPSEWVSERISEIARGVPSPFDRVLLAETCATQDIVVNLLFASNSEGKLTKDRFQQITGAAHASKYRAADELFKSALPNIQGIRNSAQNASNATRRV
jgi:hypothetical protein